jgi:hypothetical protein
MTEEEILRTYSTPGLRRHEMTRQAKKTQLQNPNYALRPEEIEELLNQLYPAPATSLADVVRIVIEQEQLEANLADAQPTRDPNGEAASPIGAVLDLIVGEERVA